MEIIIKLTESEMTERLYQGYLEYCSILRKGRANPISFVEHFFGIYLLDFQKYAFMNAWSRAYVVILASRNAGKALSLDTPVYCFENNFISRKKIADIRAGDVILDSNDNLTKVIHLNPIIIEPSYEIEFSDGDIVKCNKDHLWAIIDNNHKDYHCHIRSTDYIYHNFSIGRFSVPLYKNKINIKDTKEIMSIEMGDKIPMRCITVDNETGLFVCGENYTVTHNSFLAAPFVMAKSVLFPSFETYLLAGSSDQSAVLFKKIQDTAKKQITSVSDATDFFINELIKSNNSSDGFITHGSVKSFKLYNASTVYSVSGNFDLLRGKRSNLNVYDEFGFGRKELFEATEPFLTQDSSFVVGKDTGVEENIKPINIPNQRLILSSASSIDTHLYSLYKEYSMKMIWGHPQYFVADLNCEFPLHPTIKGISVTPLLTQETISSAIKRDPERGAREYYNKFIKDGGNKQPIKRSMIAKNIVVYLPETHNVDNKSTYMFAYDPARSHDNSICSIGKLIFDDKLGWKMRIVNCISFADVRKKTHTPMRTPDQIAMIQQALVDYNGAYAGDYERIEWLLADSGSGGAGRTIGDYFNDNWCDKNGTWHVGLCDEEEQDEQLYNFPDAIDKLRLLSPTKMKTIMIDALVEMLNLGLIEFPPDYDNKDFIMTEDENGESHMVELTEEDKEIYVQIDLMKRECYRIYRFEGSNGGHRYDLPPDRKDIDPDDRFYTLAMLAWGLQEKRRESIILPRETKNDDIEVLEEFANLF